MCTAELQSNIMKIGLSGTDGKFPGAGGSVKEDKPRPIRDATQIPLGDQVGADEITIRRRRESIKQAQENPGSHIPKGIRTRKDLLDELT